MDFNVQLQALLRQVIKDHKRILFNGNGYDQNWIDEAEKRGLPHLRNTPAALERFKAPENIALFENAGVFSKAELLSRYEIFKEEYERKVRIEADLALLLARTVIVPAAVNELQKLCGTLDSAKGASLTLKTVKKYANQIATLLDSIDEKCDALEAVDAIAEPVKAVEALRTLRQDVDALEKVMADSAWPLPKYRELLFIY